MPANSFVSLMESHHLVTSHAARHASVYARHTSRSALPEEGHSCSALSISPGVKKLGFIKDSHMCQREREREREIETV